MKIQLLWHISLNCKCWIWQYYKDFQVTCACQSLSLHYFLHCKYSVTLVLISWLTPFKKSEASRFLWMATMVPKVPKTKTHRHYLELWTIIFNKLECNQHAVPCMVCLPVKLSTTTLRFVQRSEVVKCWTSFLILTKASPVVVSALLSSIWILIILWTYRDSSNKL